MRRQSGSAVFLFHRSTYPTETGRIESDRQARRENERTRGNMSGNNEGLHQCLGADRIPYHPLTEKCGWSVLHDPTRRTEQHLRCYKCDEERRQFSFIKSFLNCDLGS